MLRRYAGLSLFAVLAACGGQDTAESCVWRLDVLGGANINVGVQKTLEAKQSTASGTCSGHEHVSWAISSNTVAEILSSTDSTAVIRGKQKGNLTVTASMTRFPSVRDSTTFQVLQPVDQ